MTVESVIALMAASILIKVAPGPGVLATIGHAMARGFRRTLAFVAGVMCGDLVYILAVLLGLAAIAREFHDVFFAIRLLGGAYLIWLGISMFRASISVHTSEAPVERGHGAAYRSGLLVTLGNPKVMLFYGGLLPTFIDIEALRSVEMMILTVLLIADFGCILAAYAYSADRARRAIRTSAVARWFNRVSGTVLIGSGTALISKS